MAFANTKDDAVTASAAYSSSVPINDATEPAASADALPAEPLPSMQSGVPPVQKTEKQKQEKPQSTSMRPFSHVGVAIKMGVNGAGFDVAVPLAQRFNLRGGASFFSLDHTFTTDGASYDASLLFKTGMLAVDWFPFGGAFRISPVVQLYNGNTVQATVTAPAGQEFSLGDQDSYSSVGNPLHGTAVVSLGNQGGSKVAPGVTLGFGNMIPRGKGEHWSVPFEMGFVYIQTPQILLNFHGFSCDTRADAIASTSPTVPGEGCSDIATDPTSVANMKQEQSDINSDLNGLRFYPILSVGVSYKF
jgi:hypothetical protein